MYVLLDVSNKRRTSDERKNILYGVNEHSYGINYHNCVLLVIDGFLFISDVGADCPGNTQPFLLRMIYR